MHRQGGGSGGSQIRVRILWSYMRFPDVDPRILDRLRVLIGSPGGATAQNTLQDILFPLLMATGNSNAALWPLAEHVLADAIHHLEQYGVREGMYLVYGAWVSRMLGSGPAARQPTPSLEHATFIESGGGSCLLHRDCVDARLRPLVIAAWFVRPDRQKTTEFIVVAMESVRTEGPSEAQAAVADRMSVGFKLIELPAIEPAETEHTPFDLTLPQVAIIETRGTKPFFFLDTNTTEFLPAGTHVMVLDHPGHPHDEVLVALERERTAFILYTELFPPIE